MEDIWVSGWSAKIWIQEVGENFLSCTQLRQMHMQQEHIKIALYMYMETKALQ